MPVSKTSSSGRMPRSRIAQRQRSTIVSGALRLGLAAEVQRAERQARHVGARVAVELEHVGAALDGGLDSRPLVLDADDRLGRVRRRIAGMNSA